MTHVHAGRMSVTHATKAMEHKQASAQLDLIAHCVTQTLAAVRRHGSFVRYIYIYTYI